MSIDTTHLGQFVAEAMDTLEEQVPDAKLGDVLLVCELQVIDEDGDEATMVRSACTDPRVHVALGLLHSARIANESR